MSLSLEGGKVSFVCTHCGLRWTIDDRRSQRLFAYDGPERRAECRGELVGRRWLSTSCWSRLHAAVCLKNYRPTDPYDVLIGISAGRKFLTSDRSDPQLAEIERLWRQFRPTVALYEGRQRRYFVGPVFRVGRVTESRLIHHLARQDRVRLISLEPRYEDEVAALLLRKWSPDQVALFFFTRVYWSEADGKANDGLARHLLARRTDVTGLRESLGDLADVDRIWRRDFTGAESWRTLRYEPKGTYLGAIGDDSRTIRGEHMTRTVIDLARRGERVFAVVGSGHVIRTELILREALDERE